MEEHKQAFEIAASLTPEEIRQWARHEIQARGLQGAAEHIASHCRSFHEDSAAPKDFFVAFTEQGFSHNHATQPEAWRHLFLLVFVLTSFGEHARRLADDATPHPAHDEGSLRATQGGKGGRA